jgi:primosomal protein N'
MIFKITFYYFQKLIEVLTCELPFKKRRTAKIGRRCQNPKENYKKITNINTTVSNNLFNPPNILTTCNFINQYHTMDSEEPIKQIVKAILGPNRSPQEAKRICQVKKNI